MIDFAPIELGSTTKNDYRRGFQIICIMFHMMADNLIKFQSTLYTFKSYF